MQLLKLFKNHIGALMVVLVLLLVQAASDLSLPGLTSEIVDVGIQQAGIEHASPDQVSDGTYRMVLMVADPEDRAIIEGSYVQDEAGVWQLAQGARGGNAREALDAAMAFALVVVGNADAIEGFDLPGVYAAYQEGALGDSDIAALKTQIREQMGLASDALIEQQAIQMVKAEYARLGVDTGAIQLRSLMATGGAMLAMALVMMAASIGVGFVASRTAATIARDLREKLFDKVVSFSDAEVQAFSAASLITRGTNDIQQIQMMVAMGMRMVLYSPILAIGGIVMVSQMNLSMAWTIALAVGLVALVLVVIFALVIPKFKIMQALIDKVNLISREMLTGIPVVRAFGRQRLEEERFDAASTDLYRTQLFTNRAMAFMMPLMMLIMNGVSVLIVWVGASYIDAGTLQTGDMIAFITYSMVIIFSFLMIGMVAIMIPRANVAAQRVNEVIVCEPSIKDPKASRFEAGAATGGARIEFNHVTFRYDEGSDPVLEDIDFAAEPGQTTAIIGPTGSGKSTLLKLVERFYDVSEGSVTIDGVDVRDMTQHELRAQLGYVPQKAFLFSGTVESTIAYGAPDASRERVEFAADVAQARDFIQAHEDGYDREISQGGTNVSGGQRQRLSIARALATNARAYLFDDSFSALDYKTDAALRQALHDNLGDRTVLIVAQRIATVLHADKIIVLDEGRIVGQGTHAQLLEGCPTYLEIASSQLSDTELAGGVA